MRRRVFTVTTMQIVRELASQGKVGSEDRARDRLDAWKRARQMQPERKISLGRRGRPSPRQARIMKPARRGSLLACLCTIFPPSNAEPRLWAVSLQLAAMLLDAIITSDIYEAVLDER